MRSKVGLLVVGVVLANVGAWAAETPIAVSPGRADTGAIVASHCPTFSWGMVSGVRSYDLLIYQVDEESEDTKPVLRESFPGSVHVWTPSLDRCLDRGQRYAWTVRAMGRKEASEWSAPSLFEVASGPSEAEFEVALQVVRQYLGRQAIGSAGAVAENGGSPSVAVRRPTPKATTSPEPRSAVAGDSDLQVNGSAVVTVATLAGALCSATELRFLDQGDGTVLDCNTGLIWLKNATCFGYITWQAAKDAAAALNSGECGLSDGSQEGHWRLPTVSEFCSEIAGDTEFQDVCPTTAAPDSLFDSSVLGSPKLVNAKGDGTWTEDDAFAGMLNNEAYWSSTSAPGETSKAWYTTTTSGFIDFNGSKAGAIARGWPVRDP